MDHRDAMNTARRSRHQNGARRSRRREPRLQPRVPNCPSRRTLLRPEGRAPNPSRHARILPLCREPSASQRVSADSWLAVPEGRRRKLAGGKTARAGAAPGCRARRAMPQRGIGESFWIGSPAPSPPPLVASDRSNCQGLPGIPDYFFDAPLGHRATRDGFRGRCPLARSCPRLISSGVPPGRPTCSHALKLDTDGAGRALQTRSVAVPSPGVHRVSVVSIPASTAATRTR